MLCFNFIMLRLCFDLSEDWIRKNPKASICTAEGVNEFKNIAIFQDYHGLPEFRQVNIYNLILKLDRIIFRWLMQKQESFTYMEKIQKWIRNLDVIMAFFDDRILFFSFFFFFSQAVTGFMGRVRWSGKVWPRPHSHGWWSNRSKRANHVLFGGSWNIQNR